MRIASQDFAENTILITLEQDLIPIADAETPSAANNFPQEY